MFYYFTKKVVFPSIKSTLAKILEKRHSETLKPFPSIFVSIIYQKIYRRSTMWNIEGFFGQIGAPKTGVLILLILLLLRLASAIIIDENQNIIRQLFLLTYVIINLGELVNLHIVSSLLKLWNVYGFNSASTCSQNSS